MREPSRFPAGGEGDRKRAVMLKRKEVDGFNICVWVMFLPYQLLFLLLQPHHPTNFRCEILSGLIISEKSEILRFSFCLFPKALSPIRKWYLVLFFSLSHKFYFFKGSFLSAGKYYLASSTTMKALPMTTPCHFPATTLLLKSHVCQDFVKLSPRSPGSSFSPVSLGHLSSVRILSLLFSHWAILQRATELPNCQKNFMESFI